MPRARPTPVTIGGRLDPSPRSLLRSARDRRAAIRFLTDGGQTAGSILHRLVAFLDGAKRSLDIAIYDAYLAPDLTDTLLAAFAAAEARGVAVRAVYNDLTKFSPEHPPKPSKASPQTGVSLLAGEMNAENVLDVHSPPFADECATFVTAVHTLSASTPAHPV